MESNNLVNKDKPSNQIIKNLHLLSDEQVLSFLTELKKNSELDYVNPLLNMLLSERSEVVRKSIVEYLSDFKDQRAVEIIVRYLEESFPSKNVSNILIACWQSRLDFSKNLSIFFSILVEANYLTSFEAFTVIENSVDNLSTDEIVKFIAYVKKGVAGSDRDKQLLLLEMVSLLDKAKREVE